MRVLVTASRRGVDPRLIHQVLDKIYEEWREQASPIEELVVVQGEAPGGDTVAKLWAMDKHCQDPQVDHEDHPADWERHGKAAGFIRNQEMVDLGADRCEGFPGKPARGTKDCMKRAKAAKIPTESHSWTWRNSVSA